MKDKNNREIKAGDVLFNPYDRDLYLPVVADEDGILYLGGMDSPLERYSPHIWWEIADGVHVA